MTAALLRHTRYCAVDYQVIAADTGSSVCGKSEGSLNETFTEDCLLFSNDSIC